MPATPLLRSLGLLAALGSLAACGSIDKNLTEGGIPKGGSLIPDTRVRLTPDYTTSVAKMVTAAASAAILNYVYQPLDPNWDVADIALSNDTHRLSLRMKRFTIGGDGEAWQLTRRYAERLQAAKGATGYVMLEYSEGLDSSTPFARRVAEGLVKFTEVPPEPRLASPG